MIHGRSRYTCSDVAHNVPIVLRRMWIRLATRFVCPTLPPVLDNLSLMLHTEIFEGWFNRSIGVRGRTLQLIRQGFCQQSQLHPCILDLPSVRELVEEDRSELWVFGALIEA